MAEQNKCPICGYDVTPIGTYYAGGSTNLRCLKCGDYEIGNIAALEISSWTEQQKINLCGWLRENQNFKLVSSNLKPLSQLPNLSVGEKAEKILIRLAQKFPTPGAWLDFTGANYQEFLAIGRTANYHELEYLLREYLHGELGYLILHELVTNLGADRNYKISPKGWTYLESLRHGNPDSPIGFIAMWFDDSVKDAQIAIENGIHNAGYKPFRVDQKEHNNDITDEIIAGIRGSKFLVADLTGHRNGVYYEAGFGKGLGLEIVWLCRESDKKDRHFDIEHLNCIFWKEDKLPELTKALTNRIVATLGHGPLQPAT
jgi:hypothetical protein